MAMVMTQDELKARTRAFAIEIVQMVLQLGQDDLARLMRPQLLRSGTGVATNYRAACRGRSTREFASRLAVALEEADESELWLDILEVLGRQPAKIIKLLRQEAIELRAIFSSAHATTMRRLKAERERRKVQKSRNP